MLAVTNMAMTRHFEVTSHKFNAMRVCTFPPKIKQRNVARNCIIDKTKVHTALEVEAFDGKFLSQLTSHREAVFMNAANFTGGGLTQCQRATSPHTAHKLSLSP